MCAPPNLKSARSVIKVLLVRVTHVLSECVCVCMCVYFQGDIKVLGACYMAVMRCQEKVDEDTVCG